MTVAEPPLSMVRRHVSEGRVHLDKQHEIIARLTASGLPTAAAQAMLLQLEDSMVSHEDHLASILKDQRLGRRDEDGNLR